jgi:hypothetical protein
MFLQAKLRCMNSTIDTDRKIPNNKSKSWCSTNSYGRHTHRGIIAGKLNGHIPAHTPSGSLILKVSIPWETLDTYSPICRDPIPQACSTTSAISEFEIKSLQPGCQVVVHVSKKSLAE